MAAEECGSGLGPGALCSGVHSWTKLKLEEAAAFPAIQPQPPAACLLGTPGLHSVLGFCLGSCRNVQ